VHPRTDRPAAADPRRRAGARTLRCVRTVLGLDLVGHGMTEAMRAARFPADEPLTEGGRNALAGRRPSRAATVLTAPERRAVETAELLGLTATVDERLRDLDAGAWRGAELAAIPEEHLRDWLSDPEFRGHGGESVLDVLARTGRWLADVADSGRSTVAVTHPAVIRAALVVALDAPPAAFWRLDVGPGAVVRLRHRGRWSLRLS